MATIKVVSSANDGKVVLWESHEDHPGGEVFIKGNGEPVSVAETPRVNTLLANGTLKLVAAPKKASAKKGSKAKSS